MYLKFLLILFFILLNGHGALAQNKAVDEITIEANVVQIILNDEHLNGVDWGAIVSDFHTEPFKKEDDGQLEGKKYRLSFGTVTQDDYAVLLDALDTVGSMRQMPLPPQKIVSGTSTSISDSKQNIVANVLFVRLKSGDISLHIQPHITWPAGDLRDGHKTTTPLALKTQTDMIVANNATIVMGGMIREEEITKTHKMPLLGSLPLLGNIPLVGLFFRYEGHWVQKTETIVFLTVRSNHEVAEVASQDTDSSS